MFSFRPFGGELSQFNIYSNVLSAASIKKIANRGICLSDLSEFDETRILRWEEILTMPRNGNVRDVEVCTRKDLFALLDEKEVALTRHEIT